VGANGSDLINMSAALRLWVFGRLNKFMLEGQGIFRTFKSLEGDSYSHAS